MESNQEYSMDTLIEMWNVYFPNFKLTVESLSTPHTVLIKMWFLREEQNENTLLYWDLLPVINATRVVNSLISQHTKIPHNINITYILQPKIHTSHALLLMLINLMNFNETMTSQIAPYEQEVFSKVEEVRTLKEKKNQLIQQLNDVAVEKAERAERFVKLDSEIKRYEEILKQEKEASESENQALEVILKENRNLEMIVEQKKSQKEAILAEVEKKRAMRVYDAGNIFAKAEQAAKNVKEDEEALESLRATLGQKENSIKNLQSIQSNLHIANNFLYDIKKLSDSLRDCEKEDSESMKDELGELEGKFAELETRLAELGAAKADANKKIQENSVKRQQERTLAKSNLRKAEEEDKKYGEMSKQAAQRVLELQALTDKYEKDKAAGFETLSNIKNNVVTELKSLDDALLKKFKESSEEIAAKLQKSRK